MIRITENTKEKAVFVKDTPNRVEPWFNHDCSNENLLKELGREGDTILRVQWEDGEYIASILNVYFKI